MDNFISPQILDYYRTPSPMTLVGDHHEIVASLPNDIESLVRIVQGLIIHQFTASSFYGYDIPGEREVEGNLRYFHEMLDQLLVLDHSPLTAKRSPDKRLVGVCHHFNKFLVAVLRAKGVPARMRYGFGNYFNPGFYEDHSICEFWDEQKEEWILVDPQFDDIWVSKLNIKHSVFNVPRDSFICAGNAWMACREDKQAPNKFGTIDDDLRGWWFIAGNIVKDVAALNKMEMLQWDAWKGMPRPNNTMKNKKTIKFFDQLAPLSVQPDSSFAELQKIYQNEDYPIRVPERVFNAMRGHLEWVSGAANKTKGKKQGKNKIVAIQKKEEVDR
ncbi:MAG TPA: transglutaminase-like domain-containing protein [Bacillota bacterium]|nr:transglutaminase-like domain-containing protein [Bacillota bacterium]